MNFRTDRAHLRDRLEQALSTDDPRINRLGGAGTSVCFQVRDDPGQSATLLLDRSPPSVIGGDEPAEITIELNNQQAERLARGSLSLPPLLLTGAVGYRGPVRKYLMVDPVLRALLSDVEGTGGH
ncbi:MAG: hypothetical protein ACYDHH_19715 [Solirubrobacteraceae bacterium]